MKDALQMQKHYGKEAKRRAKKSAQLTYSLGEAWKLGIGSKPNKPLSMAEQTAQYYARLMAKHSGPHGAARRIQQITRKMDDLQRELDDLRAARLWQLRREGVSV